MKIITENKMIKKTASVRLLGAWGWKTEERVRKRLVFLGSPEQDHFWTAGGP